MSSRERDQLIRHYFQCGYSYRLILCFLSSCHGVDISLRTLKRALRRMNLRRRRSLCYSKLVIAGSCILNELQQSGSLLGYRSMWHLLQTKYKVYVPRRTVQELLRVIDPVSVDLRRRHRLHRRIYRSKGPNYSWHIDGNDKLKHYGFYIHGCIDGYSRKILWLEVASTNKDASVIAGYYLKAVESCKGCPTILRADKGTENARVSYLQPFLRRNGTDSMAGSASFRYGRSVNNQRIEAMWLMLRKWCLDWWMDFFRQLKEEGYYDETNPIQGDCLRFAFMDLLQTELDNVTRLWNTHLIRKSWAETVSGIPDELYHIPELRGVVNCKQVYDQQDLDFCKPHGSPKPRHVPEEFINLSNILMIENNWSVPCDTQSALNLYLNLCNEIEGS